MTIFFDYKQTGIFNKLKFWFATSILGFSNALYIICPKCDGPMMLNRPSFPGTIGNGRIGTVTCMNKNCGLYERVIEGNNTLLRCGTWLP